jgi:cytochrome c553
MMRYQKVRDPELQCERCEGTGQIQETTGGGTYGRRSTVFRECEVCHSTGQNPATKTKSVELTPKQIEYVTHALSRASDGSNSEDDVIFRRLYEKFSALL